MTEVVVFGILFLMSNIQLLVLNGAPGTGKNTITRAISERLGATAVPHAVIDADELALIFDGRPFDQKKTFMWRNLAAIWPNYAETGDIKVIIPLVIDNDVELEAFTAATHGAERIMCELTAPVNVLKQRVAEREPGNQETMFKFIDRYVQRRQINAGKYADFEVTTHDKNIAETAAEVITKAGWQPLI